MLALTVEFLQRSHELKLDFSREDGLNMCVTRSSDCPGQHSSAEQRPSLARSFAALPGRRRPKSLDDLARRRQRELGSNIFPLGLGDFFFDPMIRCTRIMKMTTIF